MPQLRLRRKQPGAGHTVLLCAILLHCGREGETHYGTRIYVIILVIEDDPLVCDLLQNVFTEEGYQVIVVTNGTEALTTMTTVMPHLITLDLDLPGMTGDMIRKELRQRDDTQDLPVVIVSAKHPISQEVRKLAQGVLPKPFDLDKLIATIAKLIPPPIQGDPHTGP